MATCRVSLQSGVPSLLRSWFVGLPFWSWVSIPKNIGQVIAKKWLISWWCWASSLVMAYIVMAYIVMAYSWWCSASSRLRCLSWALWCTSTLTWSTSSRQQPNPIQFTNIHPRTSSHACTRAHVCTCTRPYAHLHVCKRAWMARFGVGQIVHMTLFGIAVMYGVFFGGVVCYNN